LAKSEHFIPDHPAEREECSRNCFLHNMKNISKPQVRVRRDRRRDYKNPPSRAIMLTHSPHLSRGANRRAGPWGKWGPTKWAGPGRVSPLSDRFRAELSKPGCLTGAGRRLVCRYVDHVEHQAITERTNWLKPRHPCLVNSLRGQFLRVFVCRAVPMLAEDFFMWRSHFRQGNLARNTQLTTGHPIDRQRKV
jgi:hypothetical protein